MSGVAARLGYEVRELIPIALYFFVAFQLLALTEMLLLGEFGIRVTAFVAAAVGAMVVAKVVVIGDRLPFMNRFPDRPLIYNVLWKASIYLLLTIVVRYVEHVIRYWRQTHDLVEAHRRLIEEVSWQHLLCVHLWLLVLLLIWCAWRELVLVLGRGRLSALFFARRHGSAGVEPGTRPAGMERR